MLTPQDVSSREFVKAVFGGYDMSAVDDFLETLTEDYTALYKENAILKSKIKVLVEKVEEYRSTEDAMRMALLTAQKMGDDLISEAKMKSEAMLTDTETAVNRRLSELSHEISDEEARLQAVKESTAQVVEASQEIIKQHMVFLSRLNEITSPDAEPEPEPSQ
jgi:cell division initiation protein